MSLAHCLFAVEKSIERKKRRRGFNPGERDLQLQCKHESENDRCEGDPFNESGGDQHVGADASGSFGLTGDAFACLSTDLTNATAGADNSQTHSDGRATHSDAFVGNQGRCLRDNIH
jgi:hypothetical protein